MGPDPLEESIHQERAGCLAMLRNHLNEKRGGNFEMSPVRIVVGKDQLLKRRPGARSCSVQPKVGPCEARTAERGTEEGKVFCKGMVSSWTSC